MKSRLLYKKIMNNHIAKIRRGFNSLLELILFLSIIGLFGCYPALQKDAQRPEEALTPIKFFYPKFNDDMNYRSLVIAIKRNLEYLNRLKPDYIFFYGPHKYTCQHVRDSQETLLNLVLKRPHPEELSRIVKKQFMIYRAAGRVGNRRVLFTGYFEPIYEGSLKSDEVFKYPIYKKPDDLIKIDLSLFNKRFGKASIIARIDGKKVLPYFSRQQIEVENALKGRNLELAWLKDPLDVTFLHIQGSGRLKLPDGEMISVGYKASNGRPYGSIGRYMLDREFLTREKMSMQSIRDYLSKHPEIMDEVLNYNQSYVFFRLLHDGPFGNINVPLTPGRSIALNARLFPKGAICFISSKKPVVDRQGIITGWDNFSRFMVNQDTGGAIKGSGRADIFWGSDQYAQLAAGHMQHEGELYVLIKKP